MKKHTKITVAVIALLLMLPFMIIPASANSRAQEWYGRDANGAVVVGDNVPIEVTSEFLTFDIQTLPYAKYYTTESFLAYDSKVTAEYTFHNPTDMTVTAKLLFPFGTSPEYGLRYVDLDKYGVTINGEKIEANIRYSSHTSDFGRFDIDYEIQKLQDEYIKDDFYSPDLPVTKYTYTVSGISEKQIEEADKNDDYYYLVIDYYGKTDGIVIFADDFHTYSTKDSNGNNIFRMREKVTNDGQEIVIYTFGRPFHEDEATEAKVYIDSLHSENYLETDVTVESKTEEMTFEEFALANYDEERGISEVDWYNAVVVDMIDGYSYTYLKIITISSYGSGFSGISLDRWFEYEITIAPGESITNTVTAPLYPLIDAWNRPIKYDYSYYLSPASCWADFGRLEIVVNTPYEMIKCNVEGFEKTDSGYRLVREGLPTNEEGVMDLYFTLENDGNTPLSQPNPDKVEGFFQRLLISIRNGILFIVIVITEFIGSIKSLIKG